MDRVISVEFDTDTQTWRVPTADVTVSQDHRVWLGRAADLRIGVEPPDPGISRRGLAVTARQSGWEMQITNSNHAWVYPWGQRPTWVQAGNTILKRWPRIGVLLVGANEKVHHWVLLESGELPAGFTLTPVQNEDNIQQTQLKSRQQGLTKSQFEAVTAVFGPHLMWPPVITPETLLLETAAKRLGVTANAVRVRLEAARKRVEALGPFRQVGVTDPEYVYLLAGAGYLPLPGPFRRG